MSGVSFWLDQLARQPTAASLSADIHSDVVIIGAGFTGLWTAYYLKQLEPSVNITLLEAKHIGFGASGRNGGWLAGTVSGEDQQLASLPQPLRRAAQQLIYQQVATVKQVLEQEQIDCDLAHGGVIYAAARYPQQLHHLKQHYAELLAAGHSDCDYQWLTAGELAEQVAIRNPFGAIYSPHCAVINPAKLVTGLAKRLRAQGVNIYEYSPVQDYQPGLVRTPSGSVTAAVVVCALEGYSGAMDFLKPRIQPVQSLIIATEPLSEPLWRQLGLRNRQAFSDEGRLVTYGQRSADNRLIFGARGGFQFGGKIRHQFDLNHPEFTLRRELMVDLFPQLDQVEISHGWGGNLAINRSFSPRALFDPTTGLAFAGGYGGEGVAASHLFGHTLAELICQRTSLRTQLPWAIDCASPQTALRRWEPEPLRWLTYQTILHSYSWDEALCRNPDAPPWLQRLSAHWCDKLALLLRD